MSKLLHRSINTVRCTCFFRSLLNSLSCKSKNEALNLVPNTNSNRQNTGYQDARSKTVLPLTKSLHSKLQDIVESLEFSHMEMATSLYLCIYASLIKRLCVSILWIVFPEIYQYSRICCLINIGVPDMNVNKAADTWILVPVYFWKNDSQYRHA